MLDVRPHGGVDTMRGRSISRIFYRHALKENFRLTLIGIFAL